MRVALLYFLCLAPPALGATASVKWQGAIPKIAEREKDWRALVGKLLSEDMPYGALAAAERMLTLFSELETKVEAYRTVVELIDRGYPYRLREVFAPGDIEPGDEYGFANSYRLYKAAINEEKGAKRWAEAYYEKIDKENFPKYLFHTALEKYAAKKTDEAMGILKRILALKGVRDRASFAAKVSRTLARLHFEKEQFKESLDIYQSFLLRMEQVTPSDWLEAAWCLYHLKRYPEALGYLYNLESPAAKDDTSALEKFALRGLIYRELCATENIDALSASFQARYGALVGAIKGGQPLAKIEGLADVWLPENAGYAAIRKAMVSMEEESKRAGSVGKLKVLAEHLYRTSLGALRTKIRLYEEDALKRSASYLVMLDESLKFVKFDAAREAFNPDIVFRPAPKTSPLERSKDYALNVRWPQDGRYWRDERLSYRADVESRCMK